MIFIIVWFLDSFDEVVTDVCLNLKFIIFLSLSLLFGVNLFNLSFVRAMVLFVLSVGFSFLAT